MRSIGALHGKEVYLSRYLFLWEESRWREEAWSIRLEGRRWGERKKEMCCREVSFPEPSISQLLRNERGEKKEWKRRGRKRTTQEEEGRQRRRGSEGRSCERNRGFKKRHTEIRSREIKRNQQEKDETRLARRPTKRRKVSERARKKRKKEEKTKKKKRREREEEEVWRGSSYMLSSVNIVVVY